MGGTTWAPAGPWRPSGAPRSLYDRDVQTLIHVSAVVLVSHGGHVLTVRKRGTKRFMLPGGKPEPGESPAQAAVRECAEEVGVELQPEELQPVGRFTAPAANEADHLVRGTIFTHPLVGSPSPAREIAEMRWLDPRRRPLPEDLAPLLAAHVIPVLNSGAKEC